MDVSDDGFELEVEGGRADGVGCGVYVSPVGPVRGGGNAFSLDGRLASESEEAEFCFRRRGQLPRSLGGPAFLPASYPLDNNLDCSGHVQRDPRPAPPAALPDVGNSSSGKSRSPPRPRRQP